SVRVATAQRRSVSRSWTTSPLRAPLRRPSRERARIARRVPYPHSHARVFLASRRRTASPEVVTRSTIPSGAPRGTLRVMLATPYRAEELRADAPAELASAVVRWARSTFGAPRRLSAHITGVEERDEVVVRVATEVVRRDLYEQRVPAGRLARRGAGSV